MVSIENHFGVAPVIDSAKNFTGTVVIDNIYYTATSANPNWETVASSSVDTRGDVTSFRRKVRPKNSSGTFKDTIQIGAINLRAIVTAPSPGVQRLGFETVSPRTGDIVSIKMLVPEETDKKDKPDWGHYKFVTLPEAKDNATPLQLQLGKFLDQSPQFPERTLDTVLMITTKDQPVYYLLRANFGSMLGHGYGDYHQSFSLQVTRNPIKFMPQQKSSPL